MNITTKVLDEKKEKKYMVVDIAVPRDKRIHRKEHKEVEKYQDLKREIVRM